MMYSAQALTARPPFMNKVYKTIILLNLGKYRLIFNEISSDFSQNGEVSGNIPPDCAG